ncbi:MAG TPA: hypothetical protein VFL12_02865, partial [Thermoanaerobaculia bacterium]|nr:hypothetical protein [Thermoanaerobaculia bacterium]
MKRSVLAVLAILGAAALPARAAVHAWSSNGPFGGPITGLAIDPSNPARLWAVSFNGGVFRSVDAGAHWTPSIDGLADLTVNVIAVDPLHASNLLVGTQEGIFRSTDGGSHWTAGNTGLTDGADIRAIA